MALEHLTSYKTSFALLRVTFILYVLASLGAFAFLYMTFQKQLAEKEKVVYLVENGGNVASANRIAGVSEEDMRIMLKDHIKDFYHAFYAFDQNSFDANIERALNLVGNSRKTLIDGYKRDNVKRLVTENNMDVSIEIENIQIDISSLNNIRARVWAIQTSTANVGGATGQIRRRMDSNVFRLRQVSRSSENPHGYLIDDFLVTSKERVIEED